jgi:hypothetical protein
MGAPVINSDNQQLRFFGGLGVIGCLPFMGNQLYIIVLVYVRFFGVWGILVEPLHRGLHH